MSPKDPIYSFQGQYHFLSNFSRSEIEIDGVVYPTVEHAFQAMKTHNKNTRVWIAQQPTPGEAKKEGRRVNLRADWEDVKLATMYALLQAKFMDPRLREQLLTTGERELIEGNTWGDTFWGVCRGTGRNHLGRLLMEIREEIRQQQPE